MFIVYLLAVALLMLTYDKECPTIFLKVFNIYWIILLLSVVFCEVLEQKKNKALQIYSFIHKAFSILCLIVD